MSQTVAMSGAVSRVEMTRGLRDALWRVLLIGLAAMGVLLIWGAEGWRLPWHISVLGLLVLALPGVAWLIERLDARLACWSLVLGLMGLCALAASWSSQGSVLILLALPVMLGMALISVPAGLLAAVCVSALVLSGPRWLPTLSHIEQGLALGLIWGATLLLWGILRHLGESFSAQWQSYQSMQHLLDEARDQRVELKQTRDDLVQANLQLARLSDRLASMRQIAEEARRAKEEFVANVSHELRTPLNMIIGFSEMISQNPQVYGNGLPGPLLADIAVIRRNSEHLARLVDDVLDLTQMETGQMALSKERVSLGEIVEAAMVAVRPLFESKGLYLRQEIVAGLPTLLCDRTRIRQVLLNLLSNAGRFTEQGGAQVRAWQEGPTLVVSVADTGPGIAPENQQRIFEPFQQVDASLRRRYGGSGLGLSISKRFIEMHGGKLWLQSELGQGTTFFFSLPCEEQALDGADNVLRWFSPYQAYEARTRPTRAPAPAPALTPRYVVLESETVLQRLLERYAGSAEVAHVQDMPQAVAELNRLPAQALIVNDASIDSVAPSLMQVTDLPYGTPLIGCWVPGEEEAARRLGVVRYLLKPIARETLLSALSELEKPVETILIVDDQPDVLQLFGRILLSAERGYRVLRADNGERALALLRERRPDVMLLDLLMPGMDGNAVLHAKRQDAQIRDIPVIAISAQDPVGESVVSQLLAVTRSGGLTLRDLLASLRTLTEALGVKSPAVAPEQPETPHD